MHYTFYYLQRVIDNKRQFIAGMYKQIYNTYINLVENTVTPECGEKIKKVLFLVNTVVLYYYMQAMSLLLFNCPVVPD